MNDAARRIALALALVIVVAACTDAGDTGAGSATGATGASPSPLPSPSLTAETILEEFLDVDGPTNSVRLVNTENGRFMARARMRLDKMGGPKVDPRNEAIAEGRCTDCQTVAVALQVVSYKRGASTITPLNVALALNVGCTRCVTVALAFQYVIPVDDHKEVSPRVRELLKDMERELKFFEQVKTVRELDAAEAERRLTSVTEKHAELKQFLSVRRDEKKTEASPSPSPTRSPATGSPSVAPSPTPSPTGAP